MLASAPGRSRCGSADRGQKPAGLRQNPCGSRSTTIAAVRFLAPGRVVGRRQPHRDDHRAVLRLRKPGGSGAERGRGAGSRSGNLARVRATTTRCAIPSPAAAGGWWAFARPRDLVLRSRRFRASARLRACATARCGTVQVRVASVTGRRSAVMRRARCASWRWRM